MKAAVFCCCLLQAGLQLTLAVVFKWLTLHNLCLKAFYLETRTVILLRNRPTRTLELLWKGSFCTRSRWSESNQSKDRKGSHDVNNNGEETHGICQNEVLFAQLYKTKVYLYYKSYVLKCTSIDRKCMLWINVYHLMKNNNVWS